MKTFPRPSLALIISGDGAARGIVLVDISKAYMQVRVADDLTYFQGIRMPWRGKISISA